MTPNERQAVRTLLATLAMLLLAAGAIALAMPQERGVLETRFSPTPGRSLNLEVRGDGAEVRIASAEHLRESRARYRFDEERFSGLLDWDSGQHRLRAIMDMRGLNYSEGSPDSRSELTLLLAPGSPVDLDLALKAGSVKVEGAGMEVEGLRLRLWAGELEAGFPTPSLLEARRRRAEIDVKVGEIRLEGLGNLPFDSIEINGTIGDITLDFHGELRLTRKVKVSQRIGEITIVVPAGMPVEARISRWGFLSEETLPNRWVREGRYALSPAAESREPELYLDIRGGIGQITIRER